MNESDTLLIRCFQSVFPELPRDAVVSASTDTVDDWDSLQSVTLMAVLEEEFELQIPPEDLSELSSFSAAREYLHRRRAAVDEQPASLDLDGEQAR